MAQSSFQKHPFNPEKDFPAFITLLNIIANAEGKPQTNQAEQLEYESWLGRDLSKQRIFVNHPDDDNTFIAYANYWKAREEPAMNAGLGIHPDWQSHPLSDDLLAWLYEQARVLNIKRLNVLATPDSLIQTVLKRHGFYLAGAYNHLEATLSQLPETILLPDGYSIRSFAEDDDPNMLVELFNRCFLDLWGHGVATLEVIQQIISIESEHKWMLFHGDDPVGYGSADSSNGLASTPGFVPEHRKLELYKALFLTQIDWLIKQGQQTIWTQSWGDAPEVIEMFKRLGFEVVDRSLGYQYDV